MSSVPNARPGGGQSVLRIRGLHQPTSLNGAASVAQDAAPANVRQPDDLSNAAHQRAHEELHTRLCEFRRGRSFVEIAERINMNRETVRRYFLGDRPSANFLIALCREYGLNPSWLLLGEGPMFPMVTRKPVRRRAAGRRR